MNICFVGPIPPPVHGFSNINLAMIDVLKCKGHIVKVIDRTKGRTGAVVVGISDQSFALFRALHAFLNAAFSNKCDLLYLGLSGGKGKFLDLLFVIIARIAGARVLFHHHSFAYINNKSIAAQLCFFFAPNAMHVVLSAEMRKEISRKYQIRLSFVHVLSNLAFQAPTSMSGENKVRDKFVFGFLSNITREKGIFEYFAIMRQLKDLGFPVEGVIAGPVDLAIAEEFDASLKLSSDIAWIGPVYDAQKKCFYDGINFLIFPTKYSNEAEPVTILEALSNGVYVFAAKRGAIREMLPDGCGIATELSNMTAAVRGYLDALDINCLQALREQIKKSFERQFEISRADLDELLVKINSSVY